MLKYLVAAQSVPVFPQNSISFIDAYIYVNIKMYEDEFIGFV